MNYKMDLSKKGIDMFFKDWQRQSLKVLWESGEGLSSRDVWERVNELRNQPISRTLLIIFLNNMVESGILSCTDLTGKGGNKTRYEAKLSEQQLKKLLSKFVKLKLNEMI